MSSSNSRATFVQIQQQVQEEAALANARALVQVSALYLLPPHLPGVQEQSHDQQLTLFKYRA